jgi:hypothetical protein
MTQETFSRQQNSHALISSDKQAWLAHKKRKEREVMFNTLYERVDNLEQVVVELQSIIKEKKA